jgi:hypothetical protein
MKTIKNAKLTFKDGVCFMQKDPKEWNVVEDDYVSDVTIERTEKTTTVRGMQNRYKRMDNYLTFRPDKDKGRCWRWLNQGPYVIQDSYVNVTHYGRIGLWIRKLRGLPVPVRPDLSKKFQNIKKITIEPGFWRMRFKVPYEVIIPNEKFFMLETPHARLKK